MDPAPLPPAVPPAETAAPGLSLSARLLNIFVTPGEVFDDVRKTGPTVANWLAPALITAVVGAISALLLVSQPAVLQKYLEPQRKLMDKQVAAGKMSRVDADRAEELAASIVKFTAPIGPAVGSFAGVFIWASVLWLIGRVALKTKINYLKAAEVVGLSGMISLLELVIRTLLIVMLGNPMISISPALFLKNPNPHNPLFALLTLLNPLTIWVLAVNAIGLAKLAGVPTSRAAVPLFVTWFALAGVLVTLATILAGAAGR